MTQLTNTTPILYNHTGGTPPALYLDSSIPPTENAKLTLTVDELASHFHISRATAFKLTKQKDFFPAMRIGKRILISVPALLKWMEGQCQEG